MIPSPDDVPEPVLLIIADISGYTRYMTANAKTLAHSQAIITELVLAIIQQINLPLEVAKLEGDAVFLFCRKQCGSPPWPEARQIIGEKLLAFFRVFSEKVGELSRSTTCSCNACAHIEKLRLKIVVHSGKALFHRVLNFTELAGVDVIIVHRLLKNSVRADQYLLLTDVAGQDLEFAAQVPLVEGAETYDDIGRINTLVFVPGARAAVPAALISLPFAKRFGRSWKLFCKLWFAPFATRPGSFRNVTSSTRAAGRILFALLTALLTPLFLPVGTIFVLIHALKPASHIGHAGDDHDHKPDGSCCNQ
ncbi:MAG TPA: DUF2652 domain-containing protein [Verrucomicrobiae bacterium]|jgi:hypothetical protein